MDLNKFLEGVPLSISDRDAQNLETLIEQLRSFESEIPANAKTLLVAVPFEDASSLALALSVGLQSLRTGKAFFRLPLKGDRG
jgi:Tfp pilus assembly PilM family ATPase